MLDEGASIRPAVLVIAGVDPTGGAGLGADLAALQAMGCQGLPVPTAWTVQDGLRVTAVGPLGGTAVAEMLEALAGLRLAAVKIGMLGGGGVAAAVADWLEGLEEPPPVVLDPVLSASGGVALVDAAGRETLAGRLVPAAALVTPNLPEAAALCPEAPVEAEALARALVGRGAGAAVVTGGHGPGDPVDVLFDGVAVTRFSRTRSPGGHGTGCRFAAGCAAGLARGHALVEAVRASGDAVARALAGPRRGSARLLTLP